jgi:hypothetical protein
MRLGHLRPLIVLAIGCTQIDEACPALPCPISSVFEITLTGSPAGTPLTTASYRVLPSGSPVACDQGAAGNTCEIMGSPGTYQIEITAPSYTTVQRTIVAPARPAARCACQLADTRFLTIAMSPTS